MDPAALGQARSREVGCFSAASQHVGTPKSNSTCCQMVAFWNILGGHLETTPLTLLMILSAPYSFSAKIS